MYSKLHPLGKRAHFHIKTNIFRVCLAWMLPPKSGSLCRGSGMKSRNMNTLMEVMTPQPLDFTQTYENNSPSRAENVNHATDFLYFMWPPLKIRLKT